MSQPIKGSVIIADGTGKVTYLEPTANNQVLTLDSTQPKGIKFINIANITGPTFFKTTAIDKSYTQSDQYEVIMSLTIPGENTNAIQSINVLSYKTSNITSYDIKIYDATNNNTIAESNFSNNNLTNNNMGTLTNLPSTESIIEVQAKKNGGNSQQKVFIKECTINYVIV